MTAMTKDEAARIADAILDDYYARQGGNGWRTALKEIILCHLLQPPKLEWSYDDDDTTWESSRYQISLGESGLFCVCKILDAEHNAAWLKEEFPTLAEAKAAAQSHSEANNA